MSKKLVILPLMGKQCRFKRREVIGKESVIEKLSHLSKNTANSLNAASVKLMSFIFNSAN